MDKIDKIVMAGECVDNRQDIADSKPLIHA